MSVADKIAGILPTMEGWCSVQKGQALADIILNNDVESVLEIGVFGGRSLVACGMAAKAAERHVSVIGIDPWKKEDCLEGDIGDANAEWWAKLDLNLIHTKCMEKIWEQCLDDVVVVIRNGSEAVWKALPNLKLDLLHIDGNHSEKASMRDIELWVPRVRKGGFVVFDDISWPTTKRAVDTLDRRLEKISDIDDCRFYRKP